MNGKNMNVYKTKDGETAVKQYYRNVIDSLEEEKNGEMKQFFINTGIRDTHVLQFGDSEKEPLVMLHGTMSNSASWFGIVNDYTDHFSVYCIDIPGEPGLSSPVRMDLTSGEPSQWLGMVLDKLGITKCHLLGMSLGSWYAINFSCCHPERVKALSMITASGIYPAKTGFIFKALLCMLLGKAGQRMLNKSIYWKAVIPDEAMQFQSLVSKHCNPMIEPIPIFSDENLGNLVMPVQYFGGDHDVLLNSQETAARIERLCPGSEVHLLEDTGHVILDQFPHVKTFLKSCLSYQMR